MTVLLKQPTVGTDISTLQPPGCCWHCGRRNTQKRGVQRAVHSPNRSASFFTGRPFMPTMTSPSTRRPKPSRTMPCQGEQDTPVSPSCWHVRSGSGQAGPNATASSNYTHLARRHERRNPFCSNPATLIVGQLQTLPTCMPALSAGVPGGTSMTSTPSRPICLSACTEGMDNGRQAIVAGCCQGFRRACTGIRLNAHAAVHACRSLLSQALSRAPTCGGAMVMPSTGRTTRPYLRICSTRPRTAHRAPQQVG